MVLGNTLHYVDDINDKGTKKFVTLKTTGALNIPLIKEVEDTEIKRKYVIDENFKNLNSNDILFNRLFDEGGTKNEIELERILRHYAPHETSGKCLVSITEAYNYPLQQWASRIYQKEFNLKNKMIHTGFHSEKVWMNILFQIIVSMITLFYHNIAITNMGIDNIFIKYLNEHNESDGYWKYIIDDIEYFIPNLGYMVNIDSTYKIKEGVMDRKSLKDPNSDPTKITKSKMYDKPYNKFRIVSNTIFNSSDDDDMEFIVKNTNFANFKQVFEDLDDKLNPRKNNGEMAPPEKIKQLIKNIRDKIDNVKNIDKLNDIFFREILYEHFGNYLHNKIGKFINDQDDKQINKNPYTEPKIGKLYVHPTKNIFMLCVESKTEKKSLISSSIENPDSRGHTDSDKFFIKIEKDFNEYLNYIRVIIPFISQFFNDLKDIFDNFNNGVINPLNRTDTSIDPTEADKIVFDFLQQNYLYNILQKLSNIREELNQKILDNNNKLKLSITPEKKELDKFNEDIQIFQRLLLPYDNFLINYLLGVIKDLDNSSDAPLLKLLRNNDTMDIDTRDGINDLSILINSLFNNYNNSPKSRKKYIEALGDIKVNDFFEIFEKAKPISLQLKELITVKSDTPEVEDEEERKNKFVSKVLPDLAVPYISEIDKSEQVYQINEHYMIDQDYKLVDGKFTSSNLIDTYIINKI